MKQIEFNYGSMDRAMEIMDRADREDLPLAALDGDRLGVLMDLCAADGRNGNPPLDYKRLLEFPRGDFAHDLLGIYKHLDRTTGKLTGGFLPRCAKLASPTKAGNVRCMDCRCDGYGCPGMPPGYEEAIMRNGDPR
jgi:hypothetical protein